MSDKLIITLILGGLNQNAPGTSPGASVISGLATTRTNEVVVRHIWLVSIRDSNGR